tara:strand:- start:126 stop:5645 length:5520 start_codon:yes stop_codon:yes gene_type:complete
MYNTISMSETNNFILPLYKVIVLDDKGIPNKLIIFNSNEEFILPDNSIFDEDEKLDLEKYSLPITTSKIKLHLDDNIRTIKRQIIKELGFNSISYEELYLFGKTETNVNLPVIYSSLETKNKGISKQKLGQLLMNFDKINNLETLVGLNKEYYSYKEIEESLQLDKKNLVLSFPIGHKFDKYQDFMFSSNPYDNLSSLDETYKMNIENPLLTFENSLLLNYPSLFKDTIYVCCAENVLKFAQNNDLSYIKSLQYYYPQLITKEVSNIEELETKKESLIENTKSMFENVSDERINLLYEVSEKDFSIQYEKKGITKINLTLHPEKQTIIPLENIFKQTFTSKDKPMIKYKSGFKKEDLYRLYSIGYAENGKKIPYLTRQQITNFSKKITGLRSYIMYILNKEINQINHYFVCTVEKNGSIHIDASFDMPISKKKVIELVTTTLNDIIKGINIYLQKQMHLRSIDNLQNPLIEVSGLDYVVELPSLKNVQDKEFYLLTNLFTITELNNNNVKMRYRRVNNFKEMDSINALINKLYKQNMNDMAIINLVSTNFDILPSKANEYLIKYLNEFTMIHGNYVNKEIDVVDNPGFDSLYSYDDVEKKIKIKINDIDSFGYIDLIENYISSFLKMTIYKEETGISKSKLDLLKREPQKSKIDEQGDNLIISENINDFAYKKNITGIIQNKKEKEEEEDDDGIFFTEEEEEQEEEEEKEEQDYGSEIENDNEDNNEIANVEKGEDEDEDSDDDINFFTKGGERKNSSGTFFYNKLKKYEPTLFKKESEGMYAKICPSQSNRQPVILTNEEKEAIDNDPIAKSAYGISIRYGTDPEKPYWYMCPRYWCLNTNKPMTEEQVKNGECGGKIIPNKLKTKIPEGHYIYEFTDDRQHKDAEGNYLHYNPGFLDKSKSSENIGIPCCFRNPFSAKQNTRRQELNINEDDISYGNEELLSGEKTEKVRSEHTYKNVLSIERVPLPEHRWGFLPLSIELFLRTDNSTSTESNNSSYIKKNESPILRYGVEKSLKKSFVACIADIYTYHNDMAVPTIGEMIEIISNKLTLDHYLKVHNGNLVSMFQPKKINNSDLNTEYYQNTKFYNSIDLNNSSQNTFLKFTIASYESFLSFLKNEDSFIDHSLLWDIVCSKEVGLFPKGLNLAIMEIENNDLRDNVSLICPTNSYLSSYFDKNKGTALLIKHGEYYEPIYIYGNTRNEQASNKVNAIKIFYNENTPTNLTSIMSMIESSLSKYCKPKDKPTVYTYKNNLSAQKVKDICEEYNIIVHEQVLNFRGQTIALMVSASQTSNKKLYLPTRPSNMINIDHIFIDSVKWLSYQRTVNMLQVISTKTEGKLLSKPIVKLEEDGLIVGIITETNQFVYINEPVQDTSQDELKTVKTTGYNNYYTIDNSLSISNKGDNIREESIKSISLETKFYIQFRNKLKDELMDLLNQEKTKKLQELAHSKEFVYEKKRILVEEEIRYLLKDVVQFVSFTPETLNTIYKLNNLFLKNEHGLCIHNENLLCLPDTNLINGVNNETLYYLKLSDEICRFHRVQSYLFNSQYLQFSNLDFNLLNSEILLIHTDVHGEYFDNLPVKNINKDVNFIPHNIANPLDMKNNTKQIKLKDQKLQDKIYDINEMEKTCIKEIIPLRNEYNLRNLFDNTYKEIIINNNLLCGYYVLSYIFSHFKHAQYNIQEIKQKLINAYNNILHEDNREDFKLRILNILAKQSKKDYVVKIKKNQLTITNMILNDNYFISQIDVWLLCHVNKFPVVLYASDNYLSMQLTENYIITSEELETNKFLCIYFDNSVTEQSFDSSISIIEPSIDGSKLLENNMKMVGLKQHLRKYKMNLIIKK